MKCKENPSKENQGLGKANNGVEKEEIRSKTSTIVFQWEIIIVH